MNGLKGIIQRVVLILPDDLSGGGLKGIIQRVVLILPDASSGERSERNYTRVVLILPDGIPSWDPKVARLRVFVEVL